MYASGPSLRLIHPGASSKQMLMPYEAIWTYFDTHLTVRLSGAYRKKSHLETYREIIRRCHEGGLDRVLLDERMIDRSVPEVDKVELGKTVARVFGGIRLTIVNKPIRINCFFENIAVNAGAQVFVHASEKAALAWLLSEKPSSLTSLAERLITDPAQDPGDAIIDEAIRVRLA